MKPRVLAILAAATAGVLLIAFLATRGGNSNSSGGISGDHAAATGDYLFPDLRTNADAIVELHVSQADKSARIVRDVGSNDWRVATLGGYPANAERVRDTVRSLVDAKILEKKTARKESHGAIGLDDPAADGTRAVLVEALSAEGKPLARLVLGDVAPSAAPNFDPNSTARFVRRADEDQSYLVVGRFPADPSSTAWVVRSIIEIPASRVREVRITPPTGPGPGTSLVVSRATETDELAISDIPTGRTVKDQTQVARLAQALAFLTLESVKPASEAADFAGFENATTFDLITFDHLFIRAHVTKHADEYWARFEALPEPVTQAAPASSDTGLLAPAANAEVSIDDPPAEPTPVEPAPAADDPTRASARDEAAALNATLAPWIFRLSATKGEQLTTTLDDVLMPAPMQGPELPQAQPAPTPEPVPLPTPESTPATEPGVDPAKVLFPESRP